MISCGGRDSGARKTQASEKNADDKVLNLYIWADYLGPDTVSSFEKLTGITVHVSYFNTNEMLESRLLAGNSGFDVVVSAGPYFQRQIRSGAYLPLDKAKLANLANLANLDPAIMARVAANDPGNVYGVVDQWGTYGIGYNEKLVAKALPGVSLNSWRLIFDPAFASKLAKCGINIIDSPAGVVRLVLKCLGKNPNEPSPQDLMEAETVLSKIRPFIRTIDTSSEIEALANGDICIGLGYNGDFVQARKRAKEAKNGIEIGFTIPEEGSLLWFDMLAIPRDAPHVSNAHLFVNYLMNPQVSANVSNVIRYATANSAATPLLDASIVADTDIFPTHERTNSSNDCSCNWTILQSNHVPLPAYGRSSRLHNSARHSPELQQFTG